MEKINFRKLKAEEVDVRVGTNKPDGKGATLLLYKDARCDMNILDETVGQLNWKREHSRDNANCVVSIYNSAIGEWVGKEDTGTESFTEKEKGIASDSFKRACFNWGIGRELYTAPLLWIPRSVMDHNEVKFGRFKCDEIDYDDNGNISKLVLSEKGRVVFSHGKNTNKKVKEEKLNLSVGEYQNKVTDVFNVLVSKHGTNTEVYKVIKMTKAKFLEELKNDPQGLYEYLEQF